MCKQKNSHPNICEAAEHYNYSTAYNGVMSMTNEELAVQIQLGASDLYAELWEQVKKLMIKILFNYLASYKLPNYIDKKDMVQELYFALCKAVQAYDDTKPYKFNTYLDYHIRKVIR